jgi:long-chain acyl-CoA synthetase
MNSSEAARGARPFPAMSLDAAHKALTAPGMPFEMEEVAIRGVPTRVWKHAPPTLREVFARAREAHGAKTFLVLEHERATFEAFARAALAIAHELAAQGVGKGERVAIAMRNLPEWPATFFGAVIGGRIAAALNAWWTGPELEYGLRDSGARVAFVDAERWERIKPHLASLSALERVYVARAQGPLEHPLGRRLEDVVGAVADWPALPDHPLPGLALEPDDDATILYTSGTTGNPKGAVGTHRNATTCVTASTFAAARRALRRGEAPPAQDPSAPQRANLVGIPFFHTTGCHSILCGGLQNGTKLVLMRRFEPEAAMRLIAQERCTHAGGVPTIAWQIVEHPARANYDLSSLEVFAYGGAPAAADLVRRIKQAFPSVAPGCGWGMTETSATFTTHLGEDYEARPESSGPALPVCEMKIVDERGEALPPGAVGELVVKGPNVVRGYWNKAEATAEVFADGWLKSGDIAFIDEEGFLFVVDRKKDMLIRGGENIYCIEVEDALARHPAVIDAAVIGLPHRTLGEEPAAVVAVRADATIGETELKAFVAAQLAAFKVPVRIAFSEDMLPRNPNGKIMKSALRKLFEH